MSTLYTTGLTPEGTVLMGGAYKMKDELGFPLDLTALICREKGILIDWVEVLVDAGRQSDANKFLDAVKEMEAQSKLDTNSFKAKFAYLISTTEGASFQDKCESVYRQKVENGKKFNEFQDKLLQVVIPVIWLIGEVAKAILLSSISFDHLTGYGEA